MIAVEDHADVGFRVIEEAQPGMGVGGSVDRIDVEGGEGFEVGPAQGRKGHGNGDWRSGERV